MLSARAGRLLLPFCITLLPVLLTRGHWLRFWRHVRPRAWDGTGHYALAQIYDQSIFPDTFGWTHAYFAGMPFPNFYPPLFFWLVSFLHHTTLFSFSTAFKLVVALPVILTPAAIWTLAWVLLDRDRLAATAAALLCVILLVDYRFVTPNPPGLDYFSTFQIGLYTQPLGFILLLAWLSTYVTAQRLYSRFVLSSLLLALTVLANFFNATTAVLFITATLITDAASNIRIKKAGERKSRRAFILRLGSPIVAACLTAFWTVPMLCQFDYFVTRPTTWSLGAFVPPAMIALYGLGLVGSFRWARRPTKATWPFLAGCLSLALCILFASYLAPRWLPFQTPRFVSTLNLLLTIPAGLALSTALLKTVSRLSAKFSGGSPKLTQANEHRARAWLWCGIAALTFVGAWALVRPATYNLAFYVTEDRERIDRVLDFARAHREGRYLVEVPHISYPMAQLDGRAINSYLGTQGNEALSVVFREASPNALFFNPLVNVFSATPDSFGFSSVLADDQDFVEQPFSQHLERAKFVGVRYMVIISPWIKENLSREEGIGGRFDLGAWSIYELKDARPAAARSLAYKPALVVSSLTVKGRRRNDYSFIRLAEEQFASNWFDVTLVHSPESQIDRLQELDNFGSLIIDRYDFSDEDRAFERLRDFSRTRSLILLSSDASLFRRIRSRVAEFPLATIVERDIEKPGVWLESESPTFRYNSSSVRSVWVKLQEILDRTKVNANGGAINIHSDVQHNTVRLTPATILNEPMPVVIPTTFHPNWQGGDGRPVYVASPFFMLTFIRQPTQITYTRYWYERLGVYISAATLILLCGALARHYMQARKSL